MAFRFWKRTAAASDVSLNLSKSGRRRPRGVGLPGVGMFYTLTRPAKKKSSRRRRSSRPDDAAEVDPAGRLTMGFFKRLITPGGEEALVDGCCELIQGHERKALEYLRKAVHLADGAFLAGFLALKKGHLDEAGRHFNNIFFQIESLGRHFTKYGLDATLRLPITDEVSALVGPDLRGVLLGLVEVYQRQGRWQDALICLNRVRRIDPDDLVVKLSVAELLMQAGVENRSACGTVIDLTRGVANDSPLHAALLLYRAKALRRAGLPDAARKLVTETIRRKKDRSEELLRALRYERALAYEDLGKRGRARGDLAKIYSEAPHYEDVAVRLGLARPKRRPPAEKAA